MNLTDLEEAADLQPQDVREYLERKWWIIRDESGGTTCIAPNGDKWWRNGTFEQHIATWIQKASDVERRSVQALMREISPRARKGLPSASARRARRHWIAICATMDRVLFGYWEEDPLLGPMLMAGNTIIAGDSIESWSFWPCDEHGNKVPWPRDAEGKEL